MDHFIEKPISVDGQCKMHKKTSTGICFCKDAVEVYNFANCC
jgi:hypothetical protein